jgi:cyclophilin family peptidyl-prolyl cis-trans isomerase
MFFARPLLSFLIVLVALSPTRLFGQNVVPTVTAQIADSTLLEGAPAEVVTLTDFFTDPDTSGVRLTTVLGNIDLALYDQRTPITVANFKNYINSGRYFVTDPTTGEPASSFIHRSVVIPDPFVIQGGGYLSTVNPSDPVHALPTQVTAFPAIVNEPDISNTRGTIAMAKLANNPNSATSQWFINLDDNLFLDTDNGGFTVFGRVIGDSLTVVDAIADVPIFNFGSPFETLPLRNFTSGLPTPDNLVTIPAISYISSLIFTATSSDSTLATATISGANLLVAPKKQGTATITVTATDSDGAQVSQSFDVTIVPNPVHLANISTRAFVGTDADVLIGGFIVRGDAPKRVILRASGPSLAAGGITNFLADPKLEVHDSTGATIASNDNWQTDPNQQTVADLDLAPGDPNEAAILLTLPANSTGIGYTVIVSGAGTGTGIGLVELYDMDSSPGSDVLNISTRGDVQTGDGVMIGGFIVSGAGSQRVLVRAIGPSLGVLGIDNPLGDPTLTLFDSQGMQIDFNDNWEDNPAKTEIEATNLAPGDPNEAALLPTLSPGGYTAIVSGAGSDPTGTALVEAYALDQ